MWVVRLWAAATAAAVEAEESPSAVLFTPVSDENVTMTMCGVHGMVLSI